MAKNQGSNNTTKNPPATTGQETPPNQDLQQNTDQNNAAGLVTPPAGLTLPDDSAEGIQQVVALLKEAYPNEDIDARLGVLFAPSVDPVDAGENAVRDILLVNGFELAFALDHLADNITEGLMAVQTAIDNRSAPEGQTFPEALVGFQFPLAVLERYIQGVLHKGIRLEDVELVIADPETDSHLRTLNFSRLLQGLAETHFYLRFL